MLNVDGKIDFNELSKFIGKNWTIVFVVIVICVIGYYIYDPSKHENNENTTNTENLESIKGDTIVKSEEIDGNVNQRKSSNVSPEENRPRNKLNNLANEQGQGVVIRFLDRKTMKPIENISITSTEVSINSTTNDHGEITIPGSVAESFGQYNAITILISHPQYYNEELVVSLSENQIFKLNSK
jgi:cbb3-type cytochrome oxidase subunit 3